jgi:hypothetical protein
VAAAPDEGVAVTGVVVDDGDGGEQLRAEHLRQLVMRVAAVGSGGDEEDDVLRWDDPLELVEDGGHDDVPRLGSRSVADADGDGLASLRDVA